jgi:hypothetical protein
MYDSGESEYKVRQYALKWYTKDVLHDEDLVTVDGWYSVDEDEEETEEAEEEESKEEK